MNEIQEMAGEVFVRGGAAGTAYALGDDLLLTAEHVVRDEKVVAIRKSRSLEVTSASVVKTSPELDAALLRCKSWEGGRIPCIARIPKPGTRCESFGFGLVERARSRAGTGRPFSGRLEGNAENEDLVWVSSGAADQGDSGALFFNQDGEPWGLLSTALSLTHRADRGRDQNVVVRLERIADAFAGESEIFRDLVRNGRRAAASRSLPKLVQRFVVLDMESAWERDLARTVVPQSLEPVFRKLTLASEGLILLTGPPHVGKSSLGRVLAHMLVQESVAPVALEWEGSVQISASELGEFRDCVVLAHDPWDGRESTRRTASTLRAISEANILVVTCRDHQLEERASESDLARAFLDANRIRIAASDYASMELRRILDRHLAWSREELTPGLADWLTTTIQSDVTLMDRLSLPHSIGFLVDACAASIPVGDDAELGRAVEKARSIEQAVAALYRDASRGEQCFLLLPMLFPGWLTEETAPLAYSRLFATAPGPGQTPSFSWCLQKYASLVAFYPRNGPIPSASDAPAGLGYDHPSFREAVCEEAFGGPWESNAIRQFVRDLLVVQPNARGEESLVAPTFEMTRLYWKQLAVQCDDGFVEELITYTGYFEDEVQDRYFGLLQVLAESYPRRVLAECRQLFDESVMEKTRVWTLWPMVHAGRRLPNEAFCAIRDTVLPVYFRGLWHPTNLYMALARLLTWHEGAQPDINLLTSDADCRRALGGALSWLEPEAFSRFGLELLRKNQSDELRNAFGAEVGRLSFFGEGPTEKEARHFRYVLSVILSNVAVGESDDLDRLLYAVLHYSYWGVSCLPQGLVGSVLEALIGRPFDDEGQTSRLIVQLARRELRNPSTWMRFLAERKGILRFKTDADEQLMLRTLAGQW